MSLAIPTLSIRRATRRGAGGVALAAALLAGSVAAQPLSGAVPAGPVASLSAAEIAALQAGDGMGLALPAEVNGYPGPRHVLDLADDLQLTETQRSRIAAILEETRAEAVRLGEAYLAAEAALDAAFAGGAADPATVVQRIERAAGLRAELRAVHLFAHLRTAPVLSEEQIAAYGALRRPDGASEGDEQAAPPHAGDGDGVEH